MVKLNNVKFAKYSSLADNSIRITMDTQELNNSEVAQLNEFKKGGRIIGNISRCCRD